MNNFENIPAELRPLKQWVLWKLEQVKGKTTKHLYSVGGVKIGANAKYQTEWASYDQAIAAFEDGGFDGIGFVFTCTPYIGIDLDGCFDEGGNLSAFAAETLAMTDTYTEYSHSGRGLHIIGIGKLPEGKRRNDKLGIEMYGDGSPRYFTMTGNAYSGGG